MVGRVPVLPDLVEYTETWTPAPPIREFLPHQRNKTDELWGGREKQDGHTRETHQRTHQNTRTHQRNKTDELWGGRGSAERNKSDERELQVPTT